MQQKKINYGILITVLILSIISILTIYSAMTYTSKALGNLALKQGIWYLVGWILVYILHKLKNEYLYKRTWFLYILGNILLLSLLLFAKPINNSRCWFIIPGIGSFQPSEFMKIFIMLSLATMIHNFRIKYNNPNFLQELLFLIKTFIIVLIPSILTFLQPDTGCVIIYLIIYLSMIFVSGIRLRWFIIAGILLSLIGGSLLWIYFYKENIFIKLFGSSLYYRLDRIFKWQSGSGIQLENSLAAIGSAGLLGHGYNKTPIYFPESSTDFIFAVYASNFGYIGVVILLIIILAFDIQILRLSRKKIEDTDKYIL